MTVTPGKHLNIGILGCGPIAQAGHFESVTKAQNTKLHAICDVAGDLVERFAVTHGAQKTFLSYEDMLADPQLDAVIIATADAFHVPAALAALAAGKHVLCEKPLGVTPEEVELTAVAASGLKLQVGHMKRFDQGLQSAGDFIDGELGQMSGVVRDSTPLCDDRCRAAADCRSAARRRQGPKADLERYYMLARSCHLVDMARYLCGDIVEVQARHLQRFGAYSWFVDVGLPMARLAIWT